MGIWQSRVVVQPLHPSLRDTPSLLHLFSELPPSTGWRCMLAIGGVMPLVMLVLVTFVMPEVIARSVCVAVRAVVCD